MLISSSNRIIYEQENFIALTPGKTESSGQIAGEIITRIKRSSYAVIADLKRTIFYI